MRTRLAFASLFIFLIIQLITTGCKKEKDNDTLPVISTTSISAITESSASSGGDISDDGGATITARGICFNTISNPSVLDNVIGCGSGSGSFTADLTGLAQNTQYYIRAYAKYFKISSSSSTGIIYGNEVSFNTDIGSGGGTPTITTLAVNAITANSAISGGNISSDGGSAILTSGICYSTSPSPTLTNNVVVSGIGMGAFTSNLTGLNPNTPYYIRAYATNAYGTAYGNEINFTTTNSSFIGTGNLMSLSAIRNLYSGSPAIFTNGTKIRGTVISDLIYGNISSSHIIFQSDSAGIEIGFDTINVFNLNDSLEIDLSGSEISTFHSLLQITSVHLNTITNLGTGSITPRIVSINQIILNQNLWESTLLRINNISFSGGGIYSGNITITDPTGTLELYTRPSASFASTPYPTGSMNNIIGYLLQYDGTPELYIRNLGDVQ